MTSVRAEVSRKADSLRWSSRELNSGESRNDGGEALMSEEALALGVRPDLVDDVHTD